MQTNLAEILAANVDYLKINNIEKAIGLNKTALVRMIARKEIPEKYKQKIENWWNEWVDTLRIDIAKQIFVDKDEAYKKIEEDRDKIFYNNLSSIGKPVTIKITERNYTKSEIKKPHQKYKEGDPSEHTSAFFLKYGAFTYDEIQTT